jgi:hypothetical protein
VSDGPNVSVTYLASILAAGWRRALELETGDSRIDELLPPNWIMTAPASVRDRAAAGARRHHQQRPVLATDLVRQERLGLAAVR